MGNLVGNISLGMNLRYTSAGKGTQNWSLDSSHTRAVVPGTGAGKVNQAGVKVLIVQDEYMTVNLKTLAAGAAESDKAMQAGDITRIAGVMIKNTSATATVLVVKPGSLGFDGLACKLPPGASVAIDYNAGIDMGTAVNIQLLSTQTNTPVEITVVGS